MNNHGRIGKTALVAAVIAALLLGTLWCAYSPRISGRGNITIGISNCRQIITAMRIYSSDHGGKYPDALPTHPQSSNEAFRALIKEGFIDNEKVFGCPMSPYVPDGKIGKAPDYHRALEADENHWAMTAGLNDSMPGSLPLLYENTSSTSWPPSWDTSAKGKKVRGRAWSNGIIIGRNDSSVGIQHIEPRPGRFNNEENSNDLFKETTDPVKYPERKMLDILREE